MFSKIFYIFGILLCSSIVLMAQKPDEGSEACLEELPSNVPTFDDEDCEYCGGCGDLSFDVPEIEGGEVIGNAYNDAQDTMIFGMLSHNEVMADVISQGDDIPFSPQTVIGLGEYIDQSIDVGAMLDCVNLNCVNNPFTDTLGIDLTSLFLEAFGNGGFSSEDEGMENVPPDLLLGLNSLSESQIIGADINQQILSQINPGCIVNGEIDFNCLVESGLGLSNYPDVPCGADIQTMRTSTTNQVKSTGSIEDEGELDLFSTRIPGTALNVPNEITPGPSAMAQMNANTQVNLYNGSLGTSLPIHTLTANDLSIPISLSMNGTGLKIDDMGTEVGNNWSLNAGGQISRVVKNLPDEYFGEREVGRGRGPNSTLKPCIGFDLGKFSIGPERINRSRFEWKPSAPNELRYHLQVFQGVITIGPIVIPFQVYVSIVVKLNVRMKPDYYTLKEKGLGSLYYLDESKISSIASNAIAPALAELLTIPNELQISQSPEGLNSLLRVANGKSRFEDQTFLSSTLGVLVNFFNGIENLFGEVNKTYTNIDLQRDRFSYNLPGYSGEFIIYTKGATEEASAEVDVIDVISKPANNLKINVGSIVEIGTGDDTEHHLSGFTVVTPEGIEYTFGDPKGPSNVDSLQGVEYSQSTIYNLPNYITYPKKDGTKKEFGPATLDQSSFPYESSFLCLPRALMYGSTYENLYTVQRSSKYISTWKLTKVRSLMTQEEVSLAYTPINGLKYRSSKTLTHKFPNFQPVADDLYPFKSPKNLHTNPIGANEYVDLKGEFTYSVVEMTLDKQRLSGIYTDRLEDVSFEYDGERPDLPGDKLLRLIKVNRSDQLYRAYQLDYSSTNESLGFACEQPENSPVSLPVADDGWTFRFNDPHTKWFDGMIALRFKRFEFKLFGRTIGLNFPWPKPTITKEADHVSLLDEYGSLLYVKGLEHPQRTVTPELIEEEESLYTAEKNRALLRSVSLIGNEGGMLPFAEMEYYGDLAQLPKRFSVKQDVWGCYNAQNASLFPGLKYMDTSGEEVDITAEEANTPGEPNVGPYLKYHFGFLQGYEQNAEFYNGQLSSTELHDAQIGALHRVILPTGGDISFTYELNDVPNLDGTVDEQSGAGIRVRTKVESAGDEGPKTTTTYAFSGATVTNHPMKIVDDKLDLSDYDVNYCPGAFLANGIDVLNYISNDESLNLPFCIDIDLANMVKSTSYPQNEWLMNGAGYVGYSEVEEILATEEVNLGKIRHEFITPIDYPAHPSSGFITGYVTNSILGIGDSYGTHHHANLSPWFAKHIPFDQRYGLEKATYAYNEEGGLVNEIVNTYEFPNSLDIIHTGKEMLTYDQRFPGNFLMDIVFRGAFSFQSPGSQTTGQAILQMLQSTAQDILLPHPYRKVYRNSYIKSDVIVIDHPRLKTSRNTTFYDDGSKHVSLTENSYALVGEKYRLTSTNTDFLKSNGDVLQSAGSEYTYLNDFPVELSESFDEGTRNYLSSFGQAGYSVPLRTLSFVNGTSVEGQMTSLKLRPSVVGLGSQVLPLANWSLVNEDWQLTNYNTAWHASTIPTESQAAKYKDEDEESFDLGDHSFFGKRTITLNSSLLPLQVTVHEDDDDTNVFSKQYVYSSSFQELQKSTDPNGIKSTYVFDEFGRLETQVSDNERVTTTYDYSLNPTILTTQVVFDDDTPTQGSIQRFNGLGMPTTVERNDGALLEETVYSDFFLVKSKKTIGQGMTAYSYENSPLKRLKTEDYAGNLTSYEYSADFSSLPANYLNHPQFLPYSLVRIADANGVDYGKFSVSVTDGLGRQILSILPEGGKTLTKYDDFSRPERIINPIGEKYVYKYNDAGLLSYKEVPNAAPDELWYDDKYRLIASKASSGAYSTLRYDGFGRVLDTYLYPNPNMAPDLPTSTDLLSSTATTGLYNEANLFMEKEYEGGKTWVKGSKSYSLLPSNTIGGGHLSTSVLDRDPIGRPIKTGAVYPGGDFTVQSTVTYNDAGLILTSSENLTGTSITEIATTSRVEYDDVLRPFEQYLSLGGTGEKMISRSIYNEEDQLDLKMLGGVEGNSFLQRVSYGYDPGTLWMTSINNMSDYTCSPRDVITYCQFFAQYEIAGNPGNACSTVSGVVVDGQSYSFPAPITITQQGTSENLETRINSILSGLGLEASFSQSTDSDRLGVRFNFSLTNFTGSAFSLTFSGSSSCQFELDFEPGDCCTPGTGASENTTPWLGTSDSPNLYYQEMTYNKLDISSITYSGDCFMGQTKYDFGYDYNHRLISADHDLFGSYAYTGGYSTSYTYDPAGNLLTLNRNGRYDQPNLPESATYDQIDKLTYKYISGTSKIKTIIDEAGNANAQPFGFPLASATYSYDGTGNLIDDVQRSYSYNALNLASTITKEDASHEMTYLNGQVYRREGEKDRYFLGGIEIRDNEFFALSFGDGRIAATESGPKFQYKLTDHLGNTTVLFEDKNGDGIITEDLNNPEASEVLQRELYYPFGLQLRGTAPLKPDAPHDYLYNGKLLESDLGISDYGARWYDPATARWNAVDPLANKFAERSPYNYVMGNPIRLTDPDGRAPTDIIIRGTAAFRSQVLSMIRRLASSSEKGFSLVRDALSSNDDLVFRQRVGTQTGNGVSYRGDNKRGGKIGVFDLNISTFKAENKEIGGNLITGTGHEFQHFHDITSTTYRGADDIPYENYEYGGEVITNSFPSTEISAVSTENEIRTAFGMSLRQTYSGVQVFGMRLDRSGSSKFKGNGLISEGEYWNLTPIGNFNFSPKSSKPSFFSLVNMWTSIKSTQETAGMNGSSSTQLRLSSSNPPRN
jgi:RHS repeat-associated protein